MPFMALARRESPTSAGTRERLIATAERLFAEHGMSVSNRQVGEAAGQSNNSVVGYHFGAKADLVLAIVRSHAPDIERRRTELLAALRPSSARPGREAPSDLAAWLEVVVRPLTDHLDALGNPTWYARFVAQATSDPVFGPLLHEETLAAPSMRTPFEGVSRILRDMPKEVLAERSDMTRYIVVHTCAERERALHLSIPTPRATWADAARGMVDALVGLWQAPVRTTRAKHVRSTKKAT